ncbi:MAG: integrin alpha [Candidatus Eisenbacteria bacterium]
MKRALRIAVLALSAASAFPSGAFASSTPPRRLAFAPDSSWTAEGDRTGARFGSAVATAGDVNGDGFSDLLIGAPGVFAGRGQAFLYLSGPSGLESTAAWFTQGALAATDLGRSVAPVGDVNSDGFADFVVGASHWADVSDNAGGVFLIWVRPMEPVRSRPGSPRASRGSRASARVPRMYGRRTAMVSGDLLVGAPNYDGVATDATRGALPRNGASYASTPAWSIESDEQGGALGTIVTGAFDLNADGFDDVAMSAPGVTNGGSVLVFLGSASGLPAAPSTEITRLDPGCAFARRSGRRERRRLRRPRGGRARLRQRRGQRGNGLDLLRRRDRRRRDAGLAGGGDEVDAHFASLATSGDLNGDGFADLCVGSGARGRAWLLGGANGPATQAAWIREEDGAGRAGAAVSGAGDLDSGRLHRPRGRAPRPGQRPDQRRSRSRPFDTARDRRQPRSFR